MNFGKRGQLMIFVIIAILLVVVVVGFFLLRGEFSLRSIPAEFNPVFSLYEGCIDQEARAALDLAGTQAGYVDLSDSEYQLPSEYAPFSSQLDFLGFPVPYWYYVAGNGVIKEQVPTEAEIERGVEKYVRENLANCDFSDFYAQGFSLDIEEGDVSVDIRDENVRVVVNNGLTVSKGDQIVRKDSFSREIGSKFGKFYHLAREIYDKQLQEAFLEGYAVDVLRLYAPVDGVELSCASEIWKTRDVHDALQEGLEANIGTLKLDGNYYQLADKKNEYFVIDKSVDESVQFLYSRDWPSRLEIYGEGVDQELMIAHPVGIQEGLGILGFCYVPYHFVYDLVFPVMIQIYEGNELFQFPVIVIVDKNLARKGVASEIEEGTNFDLCAFPSQDIEVSVADNNLGKVDAVLRYQCFDQTCPLGEAKDGKFVGKVPGCVNGFLLARAEGYADVKQLYSSNTEEKAEIFFEKQYSIEVELRVGGQIFRNGNALVSFIRDGKTMSAALPELNTVQLSEGDYEIRVFAYSNSSLVVPGSTTVRCTEVPREGIFGFLGGTQERCFDLTLPETKIDYALVGGGTGNEYLLENELMKGRLVVDVDRLPLPDSIEDLQLNFQAFQSKGVRITYEA